MNTTHTGAQRRAYSPSDLVDVARYDDEYVLLHRGRDDYFGLDAVGSEIWDLLASGHDVGAVADTLADRYGQPADVVAADVSALVSELLAAELIRQV